jgi:predicted HAD superfamily Cof-like phosphohydrolase
MFIEKVKEFHELYGVLISPVPTLTPHDEEVKNKELAALRVRLIQEELDELKEALADDDIVEVGDAIADLLYVVFGAGLVWGLPMKEMFDEVHRSNLTKLDENGKAIIRADGKVIKSHLFTPPSLGPIIEAAKNK